MSSTRKFENLLLKVFHFLVIVHYIYLIYYDHRYVLPEEVKLRGYSFGGKLVYLTVLTAILHTIYFIIALINDFIGTNDCNINTNFPLIRRIKDFTFAAFAFPLALDVSLLFWSMYVFDRESVLPERFDKIVPGPLNHGYHTNISIFILIELIAVHRVYPKRFTGLMSLGGFIGCYMVWMVIIKLVVGNFPYPILEVISIPQMIGFFAFTGSFPFWMYLLGEYLNDKIWCKSRFASK